MESHVKKVTERELFAKLSLCEQCGTVWEPRYIVQPNGEWRLQNPDCPNCSS